MKLSPKKIAALCGGLFFVGGLVTIPIVTIHYNKYDLWYKEKVEEKVYEVAWDKTMSFLHLKNWVTVENLSKYLEIFYPPELPDIPNTLIPNYVTKTYLIKNEIGFKNFVSCFDNGVNLMGSYYNSKLTYIIAIAYDNNNKNNYSVSVSILDIKNSKTATFTAIKVTEKTLI